MPLAMFGFAGGFVSPAFGDPAQAKSAAPVSSSTLASNQNQALMDATQNLVQALVKSVKQASDPDAEHALELARELPDSATDKPSEPHWTVPRDAQLQAVLSDWCQRAGWTLVWQSDYSYRIEASASFDGNFQSAVTGLFTAMAGVSPSIYPEIYKGNRVVLVKNNPTH